MMNMHQSGELEKVLEGAGVLVPIEEPQDVPIGTETASGEVVIEENAVDELGIYGKQEKKQGVRKD